MWNVLLDMWNVPGPGFFPGGVNLSSPEYLGQLFVVSLTKFSQLRMFHAAEPLAPDIVGRIADPDRPACSVHIRPTGKPQLDFSKQL